MLEGSHCRPSREHPTRTGRGRWASGNMSWFSRVGCLVGGVGLRKPQLVTAKVQALCGGKYAELSFDFCLKNAEQDDDRKQRNHDLST